MCYNTAIWNQANSSYASDYQFVSSPDAHSGASSLEIRCVTSNCLKAAILSSTIWTPPSQAYTLSMYAKCPAGRAAIVYIPNTAGGDTGKYLTCNGTWTQNTVTFTVGATASSFFFYIYNRDVEWLRVDDVVLTYSDGTVPQHPALYAGNRNVNIAGSHLNVDGKPYFALGFFDVPYADLGQVALLGANAINGLGGYASANCFNTAQESYLDRAYEFGLNFLPESASTARMGAPSLFPAAASQYSHHLANIAWYLADEPDQSQVPAAYIPPATLGAEYQALAPQLRIPVLSTFQRADWTPPSETQPYTATTDIWMAEPYGPDFGYINNSVNTFNTLAVRPIWLAQDAVDTHLIVPKAYWAAISGATGIFYFRWDDFKAAPDKMGAVSQAFKELGQLTPVIFATDSSAQITPPAGIKSIGRTWNGGQYIIAANPLPATVQGTFAVAGLAANTKILVMFENRTIVASQGGFYDAFAGVSRHVYSIAPGKTAPQLTWARPADIVVGTALSGGQLNATADVPGSFVYAPAAGTVLPVGNQQVLAVAFTPTDTALYATASGSTAINVLPKPANLAATETITRDAANRQLVMSITLTNTGGVAAQNVVLTLVHINSNAGTPVPQALGAVAPGASVTAVVRLAPTAGKVGSNATVTVRGTYSGGTFADVTATVLP